MSSTKLVPVLATDDEGATANLVNEFEQIKPRFVFSPLLNLNLQFDLCTAREVQPGVITQISNYDYPQPNVKRIQEGADSDEPDRVMVRRKAAVCITGLLRNYEKSGDYKTGFCVLEEMTGLDPAHVPADAALVHDLQATLMPNGFTDGRDQLEWFESIEGLAEEKGPIYTATLKRMIRATEESMDYAEVFRADLSRQLVASSSGSDETKKGNRSQAFEPDRVICAWVGEDAPELESRLTRKDRGQQSEVRGQAFDPQEFAQAMAAANAETLKGFAAIISDVLEAKEPGAGSQKSAGRSQKSKKP
jgi:hypothetical protein